MAAIVTYTGYFFTGYAALVMFFHILGLISSKAAFVARSLAMYISILISSIFGLGAAVILSAIGKRGLSQWAVARCFKYCMYVGTGLTFDIEDPKNHLGTARPAVFIGPHQTEVDLLMLGCMFPQYCSVTAKSQLKKIPFLGWFMTLSGAVFIDRKNSKDARQAMQGAGEEIKNKKQSVYMFPEGTRSYTKEPTMLPFKKGAFHLAVQAQVPIVPVVVANYSHIYSIKEMLFKSGSVPCKVLDPIPTTGLTAADVDELTRETREVMLKEMIALTEKARGKTAPQAAPLLKKQNGVTKASGSDMRVAA
ncbi:putative 1-acyl-sn-glycerol-3-phosphate acyltransferase [Triangularia verruculosa]|uniref:1-acyl-sn-glycerol-3-phosphate acyltransferase n=1 Tax=Triangularia verruculosa TaxID=2587418 RepID=A0AAN7ART3_9PEZI|nr:putative 1-acyl-sn-glycerol-3-phosphate acyltransferase [Triangularia verruculosa]